MRYNYDYIHTGAASDHLLQHGYLYAVLPGCDAGRGTEGGLGAADATGHNCRGVTQCRRQHLYWTGENIFYCFVYDRLIGNNIGLVGWWPKIWLGFKR